MAAIAWLGRPFTPAQDGAVSNRRALLNWLIVWVVIANAGFALLWAIGAPPRPASIMAFAIVGALVSRYPRWVQFPCFCFTMAAALLNFVGALFNLSWFSLLYSLQFFVELDPFQSPEYMVVAGAIAGLIGLAWRALRRPTALYGMESFLVVAIVVLAVAQFDSWVSQGMRGHYKREAVAGAPFTSATTQTGLDKVAGVAARAGKQRNLMIVMVESLGSPAGNPEMERLLFARYRDPAVAARFELKTGETTYYNSTTAGEIRELCGRWGDYYDLLDRKDGGCLPAELNARGFDTTAFHSFDGDFFERKTWYPNIGFEDSIFADELLREGTGECGGMFPGACDSKVPALLARHLKEGQGPQFVYWLTLNSHLPVPEFDNMATSNCERISPSLAEKFPMVCRQFAIWDSIDAAMIKEIMAPDFPPTDILIVGDHMPPYYDLETRTQFDPDSVPWLLLRWRDDQSPRPVVAAHVKAEPKA